MLGARHTIDLALRRTLNTHILRRDKRTQILITGRTRNKHLNQSLGGLTCSANEAHRERISNGAINEALVSNSNQNPNVTQDTSSADYDQFRIMNQLRTSRALRSLNNLLDLKRLNSLENRFLILLLGLIGHILQHHGIERRITSHVRKDHRDQARGTRQQNGHHRAQARNVGQPHLTLAGVGHRRRRQGRTRGGRQTRAH